MGMIGNSLAQGLISGANIQDGTVDTPDIKDSAVTAAKIASAVITPAKLSTGAPTWDTSSNIGIGGVTPLSWGGQKAIDFTYGSLSIGNMLGTALIANAYYNGTSWVYRASSTAMGYLQDSNGHQWLTATSGTAGNTFTFAQSMVLTGAGNLGLGTASPSALLHARGINTLSTNTRYLKTWVGGATSWSSGSYEELGVGYNGIRSYFTSADDWALGFSAGTSSQFSAGTQPERLRISANGVVTVLSGSSNSTSVTGLQLSDNGTSSYVTALTGGGGARSLVVRGETIDFHSGSSYGSKMKLFANGSLGINTAINNNDTYLVVGGEYNFNTTTPGTQSGQIFLTGQQTADYSTAITFNGGGGNNGAQAGIYVRGSGAYGSQMRLATTDSYAAGSKTRLTIDHSGNIGAPGGTNIYNASDARLKRNITPLTGGLAKVCALESIAYNWIEGFCPDEEDKTLYGWIAQDVQQVDENLVDAFGPHEIVVNQQAITEPLRVNEKFIVPLLVRAIQEQQAIIESLTERITALEAN